MRELEKAPEAVVDASSGVPRWGSYRGEIAHVDLRSLERGRLWTLARRKRWMYVCMTQESLWIATAVVDLGYAGNAFTFVYDGASRRMLAEHAAIGVPGALDVNDCAGEGHRARFRSKRASLAFERATGSSTYRIRVRTNQACIEADLDTTGAPPPIAAVARVRGGTVNVTQKRALLAARGEVRVAGTTIALDGALGAYDHTSGLLARHTAWKWGFAMGRASTGENVALNLVEGFVGEPECALWVDDALVPLREGRFDHDAEEPMNPWRVRTSDGAVDLAFAPGALHAERKNLGIVRSRFVQPVGVYGGRIQLEGRAPIEIESLLGVTEDQDVVW
jgi:hypothetical protein